MKNWCLNDRVIKGLWLGTSLVSFRSKTGLWMIPLSEMVAKLWYLLYVTNAWSFHLGERPVLSLLHILLSWGCTVVHPVQPRKTTFFEHFLLQIKLRCLHESYRYEYYLSIGFCLTSFRYPQIDLWWKYHTWVNTFVHLSKPLENKLFHHFLLGIGFTCLHESCRYGC
jgi:hypothetical protein